MLFSYLSADNAMTMCPGPRVCPECPRTKKVLWRRVPWMMQSLRRCVTDRCVPILNHIQAMDNHNSYRCGILRRNSDKSLKSFPPCYSVTSTALPCVFYFFKLTQPLTVSVKEKGGKPDRKPYPLPYGLRNPCRNIKSENSQDYQDYDQKPQLNCMLMNSASLVSNDPIIIR